LSTNSRVFDSGTEEGLTMDLSVTRLQNAFGILPVGNYRLIATRIQKATPDTAKAKQSATFTLPFEKCEPEATAIGALPSLAGLFPQPAPAQDVEQRLTALHEKLNLEFDLKDHKRQLEEAKAKIRDLEREADKPDAIGGFLKALEPHVGTIVKAVSPAAAAAPVSTSIAGTQPALGSSEELDQLQTSFDTLATVVGDVPTFVHALARVAAKNPEQFKQYLPIILNGSN